MSRDGELLAVLVDQERDLGVRVLAQAVQDRRESLVIGLVKVEIGDGHDPRIPPQCAGPG